MQEPWQAEIVFMGAAALLLAVSVRTWLFLGQRWAAGLPVLAFARRRPVPWRAVDVALALTVLVVLAVGLYGFAERVVGPRPAAGAAEVAGGELPSEMHPAARLMIEGEPLLVLLAVFMAVVVAPLTEEVFVRLVLQGYLERFAWSLRRRHSGLRRAAWGKVWPVAVTAVLFAALHIRPAVEVRDVRVFVLPMVTQLFAQVVAVAFCLAWLTGVRGASLTDLGISRPHWLDDLRIGIVATAAVGPPLMALNFALNALLPRGVVPDPVPLLIFGLAAGWIYFCTHRITPCLVFHAAFNGLSVALVLFARLLGVEL